MSSLARYYVGDIISHRVHAVIDGVEYLIACRMGKDNEPELDFTYLKADKVPEKFHKIGARIRYQDGLFVEDAPEMSIPDLLPIPFDELDRTPIDSFMPRYRTSDGKIYDL